MIEDVPILWLIVDLAMLSAISWGVALLFDRWVARRSPL